MIKNNTDITLILYKYNQQKIKISKQTISPKKIHLLTLVND